MKISYSFRAKQDLQDIYELNKRIPLSRTISREVTTYPLDFCLIR